jgi:hypothetical protein
LEKNLKLLQIPDFNFSGNINAYLERKRMKPELTDLAEKLKEVDDKIAEINKRMPAHSVKPPIMMQLFELEDERDAIAKQIENLKDKGKKNWDDV